MLKEKEHMVYHHEVSDEREERTLAYGTIPRSLLHRLCEGSFTGRMFNPLTDAQATSNLREQRDQWVAAGSTVVFTSGVYDMFHLNHWTHLQDSRINAIPHHYARHTAPQEGVPWDSLPQKRQAEYIRQTLSDGRIKQVVSVDGNESVARRKGYSSTKGNMARPVYDWETRAREVLAVSTIIDGIPQMIVDAVTVHDDVNPTLSETPHGGIMEIGQFVSPDVWAICVESKNVIRAFETDEVGAYSGIEPVIITPRGMYTDELLGGIFSTTLIAHRIGAVSMRLAENGEMRVGDTIE